MVARNLDSYKTVYMSKMLRPKKKRINKTTNKGLLIFIILVTSSTRDLFAEITVFDFTVKEKNVQIPL